MLKSDAQALHDSNDVLNQKALKFEKLTGKIIDDISKSAQEVNAKSGRQAILDQMRSLFGLHQTAKRASEESKAKVAELKTQIGSFDGSSKEGIQKLEQAEDASKKASAAEGKAFDALQAEFNAQYGWKSLKAHGLTQKFLDAAKSEDEAKRIATLADGELKKLLGDKKWDQVKDNVKGRQLVGDRLKTYTFDAASAPNDLSGDDALLLCKFLADVHTPDAVGASLVGHGGASFSCTLYTTVKEVTLVAKVGQDTDLNAFLLKDYFQDNVRKIKIDTAHVA